MAGIDTGDTVLHRPTGEEWLVAFVDNDRLAWCGWPEGFALLADCELLTKAAPGEREALLKQMAVMRSSDSRSRYAKRALEAQQGEGDNRG